MAALVSAPATAQPSVGLLWLKSEASSQNLAALQEGLREHGLVEGRTFRLEPRNEVVSYERLPEAAAELAKLKVDLIVAWGDTATHIE